MRLNPKAIIPFINRGGKRFTMSTKRTFIAEVETVYHKDYQCDYYRGVIIDGENKIVERCKEMHPTYDEALWDAQKKYMQSPLYSKQASSELKEKYEAYKKAKEEADRLETVFIYDPGEWNCWEYMYDHGLYRFRYVFVYIFYRAADNGI